ncbi:hypothetical protein [Propionispira raffinosivorans]|uniref:hypothetical protein n=1 Tax=Propionispira raffinosivorans TaxID=86959 RepID=UPI00039ECC5C|nr:hypothetical protein [Propionispira raffinosivorans]
MPKLVAFAKGLQQDIETVEKAVTSDLSNGFVKVPITRLRWSNGLCMDDAELVC